MVGSKMVSVFSRCLFFHLEGTLLLWQGSGGSARTTLFKDFQLTLAWGWIPQLRDSTHIDPYWWADRFILHQTISDLPWSGIRLVQLAKRFLKAQKISRLFSGWTSLGHMPWLLITAGAFGKSHSTSASENSSLRNRWNILKDPESTEIFYFDGLFA